MMIIPRNLWDQLKVASVKSVLTFGNVKEVKIKVALSSVSCDNAAMNLQSELTHWDFDKVGGYECRPME